MELKKQLTNEAIGKKYENQFDLVNHLIALAKNMIALQREPRVKIDTQNKAQIVIAEFHSGKNQIEEVIVKEPRYHYERKSDHKADETEKTTVSQEI